MSRGQRQPAWGRGRGFGSPNNPLYQHQQNPSHVNTSQMAHQNNQPWGGPSIDYYDQSYSDQSQYSGHDYSSSSYSEGSFQNSRHQFNPRTPKGQHRQHDNMSPGGPSASSTPIRNPHNNSGPSPSQGGRGYNHHDRTGSGPSPSRGGRGNRPHDRTGSRERSGPGHGRGNNRDRSWSRDRNQQHNNRGNASFDNHQQNRRNPNYGGQNPNLDNSYPPYRPRREQDPTVFLSKTLSSILRHNAEKHHLKLMKGGFLYVNEILEKVEKLRNFSVDDVIQVVQSNDKQRFSLDEDERGLKIRANQGHTLEVDDLDLKPILDADDFPRVIHGTYLEAWESIKQTGLNRMKRNHIHFAPGEPGANGVISGMRSSCEVMIYLDLEKALKDGLKFFISSNNVILTPGDENGVILPKYFSGAKNRHKGHRLDFEPNAGSKPGMNRNEKDEKAGNNKRKKEQKQNKKKDRKNESQSSESSVNNSSEPPPKVQVRSTTDSWEAVESKTDEKTSRSKPTENVSDAESSDRASESQLTEVSGRSFDTGVLSKLSKDYGDETQEGQGDQTEEEDDKEEETAVSVDDSIMEVDDPDISKTVIDDIISSEPPFVVVLCIGDKLGLEKSHIRQLAVGANATLYVFNLQNKQLMVEGGLKELLLNSIPKVFSRVDEVSFSLINEYDILLNNVPIWDLEILYEKLPSELSAKNQKALEKLNFDKGMFTKWSKANQKLEEKQEEFTQQAVMMHRMFDIFRKSLGCQSMKTIKGAIYKKAIPGEDHFLSEKMEKLKLEQKEQKKKEKKTNQKAEAEKQQGTGGSKNKKKKRKH